MMWAKILVRKSTDGAYSDMHDWLCIHSTRDEGAKVIEPHLKDETNAISSLTFSVYAGTEAATLFAPENRDKCEIWVCEYINYPTDPWQSGDHDHRYYENGEDENGKIWRYTMFVGHAVDFTPYYSANGMLTYKIMCVDNRDYLNKSIQQRRSYRLTEDTPQGSGGSTGYYEDFIAKHNAQVSGALFERDHFNAYHSVDRQTNDYEYIVDWEVTYNSIYERFINRFGGELIVNYNDYIDETPTVHFPDETSITWVDEFGRESDCEIRNGINLKSLRITTDTSELCTRLIPLGAMSEDGSRVTIETVEAAATSTTAAKPLGQYYVDIADSQYITNHGITCKTVEYDDVTEPSNLFSRAVSWLQENNRIRKTYNAEVLDLSANGGFDPLYRFRCGDYHTVVHAGMGVNEVLRIVKIDYDLEYLHKVSITFGDKYYNDIERGLAKDAATTAKVDKIVYNNNSVTTTLDAAQKAFTAPVEYGGTYEAQSVLSGKELSTSWTNGGAWAGKMGIMAEEEGLVGYPNSSASQPAIYITNYGAIITDGSITLRGDYSDLSIKINGNWVSLRDYITNHP